jgi:pyruvate dehydrogenase E2 component (dihydrolipoamide acetyltransferase)
MLIEIIVPRLGWSMEEGAFVAWLKKDGEIVKAGDPLFSLEGDKAIQEIESLDSGLLRILAHGPKPGDRVRVGQVLAHLLAVGEQTSAPAAVGDASAAQSTSKPSMPLGCPTNERVPSSRPAISPRALRVAAELGVNWTKLIGSGCTGRIRERDIRAAAKNGRAD